MGNVVMGLGVHYPLHDPMLGSLASRSGDDAYNRA
jgi:hypothetical protein